MKLLPRHIRAGRALVGATQQDLADAAKLSLATLNNIEREVAHPREKTMLRIHQALLDGGVNISSENGIETLKMALADELRLESDTPLRNMVIRLIQSKSLLKVQKIHFFCIEGDSQRCVLLLNAQYRDVWITDPGIDLRNRIGLAELAAILVGSYKEFGKNLFYSAYPISQSQLELDKDVLHTETTFHHDIDRFLSLFSEARSIISAASTSEQHPLSHVLRILRS